MSTQRMLPGRTERQNSRTLHSILTKVKEWRDVATANVAGAYLKAKFEDFVVLRIEGESVDIMCRVSEHYKQFITHENGKKGAILTIAESTVWVRRIRTLMVRTVHRNPTKARFHTEQIRPMRCQHDNKQETVHDRIVR